MKKLYYFSKTRLQFVEIKNYKSKLIFYSVLLLIAVSSLSAGSYFFISSFTNSGKNLASLRSENLLLKGKLDEVMALYDDLNTELDSIVRVNNDLRIAANLPPISEEERMVGVGGGSFDNKMDFLNHSELKISEALSYIDEVSRKIEFEKAQYSEISKKLEENERLYAAIPAIKPSGGTVALHGFGMRMHPILKLNRMHDGIDIITDVGTPVYSTGNGRIDYVGYKGGYGLVVEIDHGYGYRTLYAHLSDTKVRAGQKINRGDLIAKSGNTGLSSGPHVHYEVSHNGVKQDPSEFFFDDMGFFELTKNKKKK